MARPPCAASWCTTTLLWWFVDQALQAFPSPEDGLVNDDRKRALPPFGERGVHPPAPVGIFSPIHTLGDTDESSIPSPRLGAFAGSPPHAIAWGSTLNRGATRGPVPWVPPKPARASSRSAPALGSALGALAGAARGAYSPLHLRGAYLPAADRRGAPPGGFAPSARPTERLCQVLSELTHASQAEMAARPSGQPRHAHPPPARGTACPAVVPRLGRG
jgi:hypothetical protein